MTTPSVLRLVPARAGFLDGVAGLAAGFVLTATVGFLAGLAALIRFAFGLRTARLAGAEAEAAFATGALATGALATGALTGSAFAGAA